MRTLLGSSLQIEQSEKQAFNLDTILLFSFIKFPAKTTSVLDIGSGAGATLLYASQKTKAHITGIEIQEDRFIQAKKNIALNHLEHRLDVIHGDIRCFQHQPFDCMISNPPFFKMTEKAHISEDIEDQIARHEKELTLEECAKHASRLLKYGGKFFMVHRPDRFVEIVNTFKAYQLEIKRVRFVHPYIDQKANHVLIEATKHGNPGMKLDPPLIIYDQKHILSKEMIKIYGGNEDVT